MNGPAGTVADFVEISKVLDKLNHVVVNSSSATTSPSKRLRLIVQDVLNSDAVVVLPGWQEDSVASFVSTLAGELAIPLFIVRDGQLRPRVTVIGMSGYAQSGKDTIGKMLSEVGFERASFADRIRESLYALDPKISEDERISDAVNEKGWELAKTSTPEVRALLQRLGSEVGRDLLDENLWVTMTLRKVEDGAKVVVTDCRFPNEAEAIKRLGGEMWRVTRPGCVPVNNHPSETALDDWKFDHYFVNDGTVEDLKQQVDKVLTV